MNFKLSTERRTIIIPYTAICCIDWYKLHYDSVGPQLNYNVLFGSIHVSKAAATDCGIEIMKPLAVYVTRTLRRKSRYFTEYLLLHQ